MCVCGGNSSGDSNEHSCLKNVDEYVKNAQVSLSERSHRVHSVVHEADLACLWAGEASGQWAAAGWQSGCEWRPAVSQNGLKIAAGDLGQGTLFMTNCRLTTLSPNGFRILEITMS